MKANELRIGNYVNHNQYSAKVTGIELNRLCVDPSVYPYIGYDEIKPIPLTEEWLLKFGFDFKIDYLLQKNGFSIVFEHKGNFLMGYLESIGIDIEYVHTLQNLFFALTGEELKEQ